MWKHIQNQGMNCVIQAGTKLTPRVELRFKGDIYYLGVGNNGVVNGSCRIDTNTCVVTNVNDGVGNRPDLFGPWCFKETNCYECIHWPKER